MQAPIDFITRDVIWDGLIALTNDMGQALFKAAYSPSVRESADSSPGIFDIRGRLVAQGLFTPGHLGSMLLAVQKILATYRPAEAWEPGDVVIFNDPWLGSGHLPDIFALAPVFYDGQLRAFVATVAHHLDIGGMAPGGWSMHSTEIYQEGLHFPPVLLYRAGEVQQDLLNILRTNTRMPDSVIGDLRAELSAIQVGIRGLHELMERHGVTIVEQAFDAIIEYSEHLSKQVIAKVPDGEYFFEDFMDDTGADERPLGIRVTIRVAGDRMQIDFAGTDPQRPCPFNCVYNYAYAYTVSSLKSVLDPTTPQNEGFCAPIQVDIPPGSFLNAQPPAAVGGRSIVAHRIFDVVVGALAQALPDRVCAGSAGGNENITISRFDPVTNRYLVHHEANYGGFGARPTSDGINGISSVANIANCPVEVLEAQVPVRVERYELVPDSGGAGRWRGGTALRRDLVMLEDCHIAHLSDRHHFRPYGLKGGLPGTSGKLLIDGEEPPRTKDEYDLEAGTRFQMIAPGSGGYGDPLEREPERVAEDVRDGYVSREKAFDLYGVILDPRTYAVDVEGTRRERARRRAP